MDIHQAKDLNEGVEKFHDFFKNEKKERKKVRSTSQTLPNISTNTDGRRWTKRQRSEKICDVELEVYAQKHGQQKGKQKTNTQHWQQRERAKPGSSWRGFSKAKQLLYLLEIDQSSGRLYGI